MELEKRCPKCDEIKPICEFSPGTKSRIYPDRRHGYCKKCNAERAELYRLTHPERASATAEYYRAYWAKHRGERKPRKHPPSERNKMTVSLRYSILERDRFACVLCGRAVPDGAKLHVDHIISICRGGKSTPDNLRTLCQDCNYGRPDAC
jgi:5-methylcytosine-specific restriction endonuclease McrA